MSKQYRSRAMASVHETAEGLHKAGLLDKQTMRKFDALRLHINAGADALKRGEYIEIADDDLDAWLETLTRQADACRRLPPGEAK